MAASEGSVVFENELLQLIQYAPLTDKVASRPLLIVPPCINKFYILDLQPENSFVRFACEQGLTVFLVSWRNPDAELGHLTWDDYIEQGVMKAIDARARDQPCRQGQRAGLVRGRHDLLSSTLAVLRARGDERVASLTLLTTMLDFTEPGDLGVFLDEPGVSQREMTIGEGGIYPGAELGFVFQTLRANDLIWPYVVNNYLKGKAPAAFDLLYWNADAHQPAGPDVRLVPAQHVPGEQPARARTGCRCAARRSTSDGSTCRATCSRRRRTTSCRGARPIARRSSWAARREFVLGASGHIAGVINPASKNKRSYWTGGKARRRRRSNGWPRAQSRPGSWWTHWAELDQAHVRQAGSCAQEARQRQPQADRAGAGSLREGAHRLTSSAMLAATIGAVMATIRDPVPSRLAQPARAAQRLRDGLRSSSQSAGRLARAADLNLAGASSERLRAVTPRPARPGRPRAWRLASRSFCAFSGAPERFALA